MGLRHRHHHSGLPDRFQGVLMNKERSCEVFLPDDSEWIAYFDYSRGRPGRNYMPNGDPGYPEEPPEVTVNRLVSKLSTIKAEDLDDPTYESVWQQCIDVAIQQDETDMVNYYESLDRRCE